MYKKKQLIYALTALLLVSCSKTDDTLITNPTGDAIYFSAYSGLVSTKASDKVKFGIGDKIKVSAFHHIGDIGDNPVSGDPQIFLPNFFNNLTVSAVAMPGSITDSYEWTYDNERHWPINKNEYLSFVATYSQTPKDIAVTETGVISIDNFTVDTDASKQEDLLWSGIANRESGDGLVNFTFNHSLSRIIFKAKTEQSYSNAVITIKSIEIKDIVNTGSYLFGILGKNVVEWTKGYWSLPANTGNTSNYSPLLTTATKTQVVTNTINQIGQSLLLIPQVVTNKVIYLNYTIKDIKLDVETKQTEIKIRPKNNWNQNTEYTYNLNFKLDAINFATVLISEWQKGNDQEVLNDVTSK